MKSLRSPPTTKSATKPTCSPETAKRCAMPASDSPSPDELDQEPMSLAEEIAAGIGMVVTRECGVQR